MVVGVREPAGGRRWVEVVVERERRKRFGRGGVEIREGRTRERMRKDEG